MSLITDQVKEEMRDTKKLAGWGRLGEGGGQQQTKIRIRVMFIPLSCCFINAPLRCF